MRKRALRRPKFTPSLVLSALALFVALGGTSLAATGGALILGQSNDATITTSLSAKVGGAALQVSNTKTKPGSTGLALNVAAGHPPFTTTSTGLVPNLNADLFDGLDSSDFLRTSAPQTVSGSDPTSAFSATNTGNGNGVQGITSGHASGVYGENDNGGFGVAGRSNADGGIGILGEGTSDSGLAGKFIGNVQIQGGLICAACIGDTALVHPPAHAYVHFDPNVFFILDAGSPAVTVASLDLPAGDQLLNATLWVQDSGSGSTISCTTTPASTQGETSLAAGAFDTMAIAGLMHLSQPDTMTLNCRNLAPSGTAYVDLVTFSALNFGAGTITVQ